MPNEHLGQIRFESQGSLDIGHFRAMANPCAIFVDNNTDSTTARSAMHEIAEEAWRIEQKYSRYLPSSPLSIINNAQGKITNIDSETYHLLTLANVLWQESGGMFDISSGVFRKIWNFDQQHIPTQTQINEQLKHVGWQHIEITEQQITLPVGMQIDFGGIGKEYAADRCAAIAHQSLGNSVMINLGGDIVAKGPRADQRPWEIGIETKEGGGKIWKTIPLTTGAIATSGDVYKAIIHEGKRYGHIINALTGYPVIDSPSTVTIAAPSCTEAGILSTLAMLKGSLAENFLQAQGRPFWIQQ
ncbi:MAG: Thiamin biosynthesis lipoprotein ApbE [uncultured Thiotrichaceae bacterium]|uniref:FAD:protein FMN transferase n=1 Tax=uncultured Thiotrichaceae bacterium TaxID=298394 RepID=A0A6S6TQ91_9GAMM|nr:MAG: Thiamin biosynthesis lipoprotein ApbE [uncultured Thiotrichaceae bacterium]